MGGKSNGAKTSRWKKGVVYPAGAILFVCVLAMYDTIRTAKIRTCQTLSELSLTVAFPERLRSLPISDIRWKYEDPFGETVAIWGNVTDSDTVLSWASQVANVEFSPVDDLVDASSFKQFSPNDDLTHVANVESSSVAHIFLGNQSVVVFAR